MHDNKRSLFRKKQDSTYKIPHTNGLIKLTAITRVTDQESLYLS